mmetsp:Transcript_58295/g.161178  ORF Transcript_58295/g.161178 Transcript_58295/m.161178 type:complete len:308 (+) Transcript_58295:202-1125(+)
MGRWQARPHHQRHDNLLGGWDDHRNGGHIPWPLQHDIVGHCLPWCCGQELPGHPLERRLRVDPLGTGGLGRRVAAGIGGAAAEARHQRQHAALVRRLHHGNPGDQARLLLHNHQRSDLPLPPGARWPAVEVERWRLLGARPAAEEVRGQRAAHEVCAPRGRPRHPGQCSVCCRRGLLPSPGLESLPCRALALAATVVRRAGMAVRGRLVSDALVARSWGLGSLPGHCSRQRSAEIHGDAGGLRRGPGRGGGEAGAAVAPGAHEVCGLAAHHLVPRGSREPRGPLGLCLDYLLHDPCGLCGRLPAPHP